MLWLLQLFPVTVAAGPAAVGQHAPPLPHLLVGCCAAAGGRSVEGLTASLQAGLSQPVGPTVPLHVQAVDTLATILLNMNTIVDTQATALKK